MELRRTWCEVNTSALKANLRALRGLSSAATRLTPVVKGNAYGHGLELCARAFLESGADGLCVDSLHEATALRAAGIEGFLYILGHVPGEHAEALVEADCSVVIYNGGDANAFSQAAAARGRRVGVHVKLETGNHRQGLYPDEARALIREIQEMPGLRLEGISSHFANIEDTTDHRFARDQLVAFNRFIKELKISGGMISAPNIANSAATILWPEAQHGLARVGIACYGMWPSKETLLSTMLTGQTPIALRPALSWRTRIAQLREIPAGAFVGYGTTFQATHRTRLAVLPVGYYDGYDRKLSNLAHVLVRGRRAPVRGRVCMNMVMIDVTDVPGVEQGDVVTLLGDDGEGSVRAEDLASWIGTINYEVTTRIHEAIPRRATNDEAS